MNTKLTFPKEPILITESHRSLRRKDQNDYLISIKDSKFSKVIIQCTNTRIYLKKDDLITEISNILLPIPPTYSNRKMIRLDLNELEEYDSVLIQLENSKSQADIYQIENKDQIVELST